MSILVDEHTTFMIQGITGREAVNMTRECLDYGSKIVAGVTPGRGGRDVYGVPVYDTVREAVEKHVIDGSVITVPPAFTRDAAFEAIENGIKLIVIVTERIPRLEVAQIVELARDARCAHHRPELSRSDHARQVQVGGIGRRGCRHAQGVRAWPDRNHVALGRHDDRDRQRAHAAGLGQSTAISIGGDTIIGSTYAELMPLFEADPETKAIAIYSEPGGPMDAQLAEWVTANKSRLPIVAFMAGRFIDKMPGMRFGHAGTIVEGRQDTTAEKDPPVERSRHRRGGCHRRHTVVGEGAYLNSELWRLLIMREK